jgi:predicted PurR-regulated permease PerM
MQDASPKSSLGQILLILASTIILLLGMRLAAPILNPLLFALVLSLLVSPLYGWLRRQRFPSWIALIVMLVGLAFGFGLLTYILTISVTDLAGRLSTYVGQLDNRIEQLTLWLNEQGIETVNPAQIVNGNNITRLLQLVLGAIGGLVSNFSLILMTTLFFVAEGPFMMRRLRRTANNPQVERLTDFGESVIQQFGLRAIVNAVTGAIVAVSLFILGVDSAFLWGILTFFLSYLPYIGTILAAIPAVLLALAEFGLGRAIAVGIIFTAANIFAENVLSPSLLSKGLNISPTVVFLSFAFWTWLLGGTGAFLAMPLTFFVILILDSFPESRWLAAVMMVNEEEETEEQASDENEPMSG